MKSALRMVKEKWLRYLLESVVIILSIISAFMLDNWHSQKQEFGFFTKTSAYESYKESGTDIIKNR